VLNVFPAVTLVFLFSVPSSLLLRRRETEKRDQWPDSKTDSESDEFASNILLKI
jgi:hypothetical protein